MLPAEYKQQWKTVVKNLKALCRYAEKRGKGLGLRVGVKKVGCSGYAYTFDYADEVRPDDHLVEAFGAKVAVDAGSLASCGMISQAG